MDDRVRVLGERDDVPAVLNAFDLFVLGSLGEGMSNAVLEAMATGRCWRLVSEVTASWWSTTLRVSSCLVGPTRPWWKRCGAIWITRSSCARRGERDGFASRRSSHSRPRLARTARCITDICLRRPDLGVHVNASLCLRICGQRLQDPIRLPV